MIVHIDRLRRYEGAISEAQEQWKQSVLGAGEGGEPRAPTASPVAASEPQSVSPGRAGQLLQVGEVNTVGAPRCLCDAAYV